LILVFSFFRGVAPALGNNTSAVVRQGASVVRRVRGGETSHLRVESIRFWHHNAPRRFEQPFFSIPVGNDIFCFFKVSSCSPCPEDHGGGLGFARRPVVEQPHRQVETQKRASRIASVPNRPVRGSRKLGFSGPAHFFRFLCWVARRVVSSLRSCAHGVPPFSPLPPHGPMTPVGANPSTGRWCPVVARKGVLSGPGHHTSFCCVSALLAACVGLPARCGLHTCRGHDQVTHEHLT
jgi:hypothetical protein